MQRKDGTWDTRSDQPQIGYEFFENGLRCPTCEHDVPDDSLVCPFCLRASSPDTNPGAKPRRRRSFRALDPHQERLPLNGYTKLD